MRKNLIEKEFNEWKENWMRGKGCPFFACSQAFFRDVCGRAHLCGVLYDYKMYQTQKWIKECDIELSEDKSNTLPTKICPACTGSMCFKIDTETGSFLSKSWCKLMNDFYVNMGYKVDRSWEKYIFSMAVFFLPIIGEEAYLDLCQNPDKLQEMMNGTKSREIQK
jgi:hypothetical protein